MARFVAEIDIPATPHRVWEVLTDFDAYADWHPHQIIQGKAELFAGLRVISRAGASGPDRQVARAIVWKFHPVDKFEYISGWPLIDLSRRFFHLISHDGGVRLRHGIVFSGIVSAWKFSHGHDIDRLEPLYRAFGEALIRRAKSSKRSPPTNGNRHERRAAQARKVHHS